MQAVTLVDLEHWGSPQIAAKTLIKLEFIPILGSSHKSVITSDLMIDNFLS